MAIRFLTRFNTRGTGQELRVELHVESTGEGEGVDLIITASVDIALDEGIVLIGVGFVDEDGYILAQHLGLGRQGKKVSHTTTVDSRRSTHTTAGAAPNLLVAKQLRRLPVDGEDDPLGVDRDEARLVLHTTVVSTQIWSMISIPGGVG
jgi:outer membrane protein assembly factor BamB